MNRRPPAITSAMVLLAWAVLEGPAEQVPEAARALAQLIRDAVEAG